MKVGRWARIWAEFLGLLDWREVELDVHAPHHPIGGWKDFFIHLITITVGLLIAVGIEGMVELHHEHALVREARETLRGEIEHNNEQLKSAVESVKEQKALTKKNIDGLTKIQENPKDKEAQKGGLNATFRMMTLDNTAWRTAQTTGALAYMPYKEAEKYASIYESQQAFVDQQGKILEDEARFLGLIQKYDIGHGDTTAEQASGLAEVLGQWQAHLVYLDLTAKISAAMDQAFLDGKDAPKSMNEDFGVGK